MPGRRLPSRRGNAVIGGNAPTLEGSLQLSDSSVFLSITAGEYIEFWDDIFTLSNGGPGNWNNPQYAISYSDATGWLSFSIGQNGEVWDFTPKVQAVSLTESTQVATVTFTDSNVSNSGLQMTITVAVAAAIPILQLSSSTLSFSLVDEAAPGSAKTITVDNAGSYGTLASPTIGTITGAGASYIDSVDVTGSAGGPYTITVTPLAVGGTVGGPYQAVIPISCSGASNSPANLTASITVVSSQTAVIGLYRTLDDAQFIIGGANPTAQQVGFRNTGSGTLAGVTVQSTTYGGVASGWGTTSIANGILSVDIDTAGIVDEGYSTCDVVLADANAAATATYTVLLKSQNAVVYPYLSVSPASIGPITITNGSNPSNRTTTIQNVNGSLADLGAMSVTLSPGVAWANIASVVNGLATIVFTTSALANGSYNTSVVVAAPNATNSPVTIPVNIVVQAASSGYEAIPWTLPTGASHNTTTDDVSYDPVTSPADSSGFA